MKLGRDVATGLGLSAISMGVSLMVVPWYVRYLGIESYGLIGFFAALQGVMQVLDLGLAPTVNREIARLTTLKKYDSARDFVRTLGWVYWGMALVIGCGVTLVAPFLARYWLRVENLPMAQVSQAVLLMGLTVAARWPVALYQGTLTGAGRLSLGNLLMLVSSVIGSLGAVGVLAFGPRTIDSFFAWQMLVGIIQAISMRALAWSVLPGTRAPVFDPGVLREVWRFSAAMSGVAFSAIIFGQLDKLVLSRVVSLKDFGYYALASTVASALYRLVSPMFNAVYPRFSAYIARGDQAGLARIYGLTTNLFGCVFYPAAMVLTICAKPLILLWTNDRIVAAAAGPLVTVLALGSAIHAAMYFPYALQLAEGDARMPLKINMILLVLMFPLIIALSLSLGVLGGALGWLILHTLYFPLGTWMTHRKHLVGRGWNWVLRDVGRPSAVTVVAGLAALLVISLSGASALASIAIGGAFALIAVAAGLATSPYSRTQMFAVLRD